MAALIMAVCSLITMTVVIALGAEPSTPNEYFTVLRTNRLVGLLRLDFSSVISVALYYPVFLALYGALRRASAAYAALGTALAFVGVTLWFATHSAFSMVSLSGQYAAATTDAQRSQVLAAGEAILAVAKSTGALVGGVLLEGGAVMISVVMLRSKIFGKVTSYAGILANGFDLAHIIINVFAPGAGNILMAVAGPFYPIWFVLLGRRLYQVGRVENKAFSQPA